MDFKEIGATIQGMKEKIGWVVKVFFYKEHFFSLVECKELIQT